MSAAVKCFGIKDPDGRIHPFYTAYYRRDAIRRLVWNLHDEPWKQLKKKGWKAVKVKIVEVK